MAQHPIKATNATIDPETGYLAIANSPFTPSLKKLFLETYEKTGNQAKGMEAIGFSHRILAGHLAVDKKFMEDYRDTVRKMVSALEATMYQNALLPKGTLDRFGWLRAHAPEKYSPKATIEHKSSTDKSKMESLYERAVDAEVVVDQIEDNKPNEKAEEA